MMLADAVCRCRHCRSHRSVVLFFTPELCPHVHGIEQELLIATVPVLKRRFRYPVAVVVPPQVLVSSFGVATMRLAGRVSSERHPVSATYLLLDL